MLLNFQFNYYVRYGFFGICSKEPKNRASISKSNTIPKPSQFIESLSRSHPIRAPIGFCSKMILAKKANAVADSFNSFVLNLFR